MITLNTFTASGMGQLAAAALPATKWSRETDSDLLTTEATSVILLMTHSGWVHKMVSGMKLYAEKNYYSCDMATIPVY